MNTLEQTEAPTVALIESAEVHPLRVLDLDRAKPRLPADSVLVRASDDATGIALLIELAIKMGQPISELLDAQERIMAIRARQQYVGAMQEFRGDCPPVPKAKFANMGTWGFTYAPLDVVDEHIRPYCRKYGFVHHWDQIPPAPDLPSIVGVKCIITHAGGHSESATFWAPKGVNNAISGGQNVAVGNTFGERQSLIMAYGLTSTDNFDDEALLAAMNTGMKPAEAAFKKVEPPRRREPAAQDAQRERPAQAEQRPAQQAGTRTAGAGVRLASEKQCNLIKVRADRAGVAEADLLRRFNLDSLDAVPGASVDAILEFISKVAP